MQAINKMLVLAIMLVSFIGQAFALTSALPCESAEQANFSLSSHLADNIQESPNINRLLASEFVDKTTAEVPNDEHCCQIDCCYADCLCVSSACSFVVYFHTSSNFFITYLFSEATGKYQPKQPSALASLRYRPPIFKA